MSKKLLFLVVQIVMLQNIVYGQVTVFFEDFDSYVVGEQLACQNPAEWTTWHNTPCDPVEDAIISDNFSYSGLNSVVFKEDNDVLRLLGGISYGKYKISFMMYIPNGSAGYFNIMSKCILGSSGSIWSLEVYFWGGEMGLLVADGGYPFTYSYDQWISVETIIDLNSDIAEFYFADTLIHTWSWSLWGTKPKEIDATNFYGYYTPIGMHVDDYKVEDLSNETLKYYPLHTGNYWEYKNYYWESPVSFDSTAHSINVIGDTVLSNNFKYKILLKKNIPDDGNSQKIYERIDSSTACIYRYSIPTNNEYLIDSLVAQPGDTIWSGGYYTLCIDEYEDTVLSLVTEVKEFEDRTIIPVLNYKYAKNLGFISSISCEFSCASSKLVYALIDGEEYGIKISSLNEPKASTVPSKFILLQNYPNPFNPMTKVKYEIPERSFVTIRVYDVLGKEIATLVNEEKHAGEYEVEFNAAKLSSGIYFYKLQAGDPSTGSGQSFIQTKKMVLLR